MTPRKFPRSRYFIFAVAVCLTLFLDLASKAWAFQYCGMPNGEIRWWIPGILGCQTSLNEGALWGMGQGFTCFFCLMSAFAFLLIGTWLFWNGMAKSKFWTLTLGMMAGGAAGNLFDRLGLHQMVWQAEFIPWVNQVPLHQPNEPIYAVRDWILVMLGSYHWPNFNLADSFLVAGMILILGCVFFQKDPESENAKSSETSTNPSEEAV